ncbi:MAG: DUF456 family protein [Halarchaeum sp.]
MDAFVLAAFALLVAGVAGTVVPLVPGALVSLAGVLVYWWTSGYVSPGPLVLAGLVLVCLLTLAVDYFGGAVGASASGASGRTVAAAALVGFVLMVVLGPIGLIVGTAGTVFLAEYARHADVRRGARAAAYATVGVLASAVVQALLLLGVLAAMALVALS